MKQERMTAAKYNKMRTESTDQRVLAKYLDAAGLCWLHVPNEGKRSKITGRFLKLAGLKPGAPDNFIFDPPPKYPGMVGAAIELKRASGGEVTDKQRDWILELRKRGWVAVIAEGLDEALEVLRNWGYFK